MDMKKMVVPFELKEVVEEQGFFNFEGYLSTFGNADLGDDVVMPGAFTESIKELQAKGGNLPILWQHNHDEPLGIFTSLVEDSKGLFVKGKMPVSDTFVSGRVMPQMKVGSISKMSIGYSCWGNGAYVVVDGKRELHKIKLWEGSIVTTPMNPEAEITGMKSAVPFQDLPLADRDTFWNADAAIGRVREWAGAEEGGIEDPDVQRKFQKAFLYYDRTEGDSFYSYKLPIADVIDGNLVAVPRGIFAAAGAMRGGRNSVYLERHDRPPIVRSIEKYYEKMGLESPFNEKGAFRLDDFSSVDEKTLETILKSGICFSGSNAKAIVSAIKSAGLRDEASEGNRDGDDDLDGLKNLLGNCLTKIKIQED